MPGARPASVDPAEGAAGTGRRGGADRGHCRAGISVWALRLPPDRGHGSRDAGWAVNVKRVERIWRQEGLKVPQKQPKKGRLWLNDGSCIRLRPERPNHVWSYDFVESRTHDGRKFRMLNVVDEFTRECLAIRVDRKLNSTAVIDVLTDLFILRGVPGHVRSDNVLCPEQLTDLGVGLCSHRCCPIRPQLAAGSFAGQRAVSPITNTEYALGGSHRPQDEILSQPGRRPEHYLRDRRQPGRRLHGLMREGSFRRASSPRRRDDRVGRL